MTIEEFEQLSEEQDGVRYELDEGKLAPLTLAMPRHSRAVERIYIALEDFIRNHPLGEVFFPRTGYVLSREPATLRGPDLSFIRSDRAGRIDLERNIEGAPDLAIEVVSPNDTARELNRRVDQFLRSGASAVWVFYPDSRQVHVHDPEGVRKLSEKEKLEDPELLPGFSVAVGDFFEL